MVSRDFSCNPPSGHRSKIDSLRDQISKMHEASAHNIEIVEKNTISIHQVGRKFKGYHKPKTKEYYHSFVQPKETLSVTLG